MGKEKIITRGPSVDRERLSSKSHRPEADQRRTRADWPMSMRCRVKPHPVGVCKRNVSYKQQEDVSVEGWRKKDEEEKKEKNNKLEEPDGNI